MPGVKEEHVVGGLYCGRLAWNGRSAIADAREAELRAEIERLLVQLSESQRVIGKYEAEQSANSMMVLVEHDEHDRLLALDEENKLLLAENANLRERLNSTTPCTLRDQ